MRGLYNGNIVGYLCKKGRGAGEVNSMTVNKTIFAVSNISHIFLSKSHPKYIKYTLHYGLPTTDLFIIYHIIASLSNASTLKQVKFHIGLISWHKQLQTTAMKSIAWADVHLCNVWHVMWKPYPTFSLVQISSNNKWNQKKFHNCI